jgi:hypothetical protein
MPDNNFKKSHAAWDGAKKTVKEGKIELKEGIACSDDTEI